MKKAEIEQDIKEIHYRLSKMNDKIQLMEEGDRRREYEDFIKKISGQINRLDRKISNLSDELYAHIAKQDQQVIHYMDETAMNLENRMKGLSDELYEHIGSRLSAVNAQWEQYREAKRQDEWMTKFGYDSMVSDLQLAQIESIVPGNRRRLAGLQNTHVGETCFVIGNGPSLRPADLDMLKQKQIFCLASKGIYTIFNQTDWRPDLWGVSDLDYLELKQDDIQRLDGFPKLVCAQAYLKKGILIKDAIYYPFIQAERMPAFFNQDIMKGIHFYGTITGKLINIAVYMGFREIYLLGCDHTCPIKTDENGKKILDTGKSFHFSDDYYVSEEEEQKAYQNNLDLERSMQYVTDAYRDIKYACETLGIKIYNATRGGELEVFPRTDMEAYMRCNV